MSTSNVVRLRTSALGGGHRYRFGSGYLIGPGLVLTAAHTLRTPGAARGPCNGDVCQVLREGDERTGWMPGSVLALESSADLAVVSVPDLVRGVAPVRWGKLDGGNEPVRWTARGFPVAGLSAHGRAREDCWGQVSPASGNVDGRMALTITSRAAKPLPSGKSGWAGLSGAAVLCHGHLVGIVVEDPKEYQDSLTARRIEWLQRWPVLHDAAGSPRFQRVSSAGVQLDGRAPMDQWTTVVAGLLAKVASPGYELVGAQLDVATDDWSASNHAHLVMAERLLSSQLDDIADSLCTLLTWLEDPRYGKMLIDHVVPIWVAHQAANHLRSLVEDELTQLLLLNLSSELSAREYVRRAWHCSIRDRQIIGVPVAGEEQEITVIGDVEAALRRLPARVKPEDTALFVLIGPNLTATCAGVALSTRFPATAYPNLRIVMYPGPDVTTALDASPGARLVEPAVRPETEQDARATHDLLLAAIIPGHHDS